jgi:hypothetical protein
MTKALFDQERVRAVAVRWQERDREPALDWIREQPTAVQGAYLALCIVSALEDLHNFEAFLELKRELAELVDFEQRKTIPCKAWAEPAHVED